MLEIDNERKPNLCSTGIHTFLTENVEEKQGPKGPYLLFTLRCVDQGDDYGQAVWHNVSLTPQSRWIVEQVLNAYNIPETGKTLITDFLNKYVRAQIYHEEYEGRTRAKVNSMLAVPSNFKPAQTTTTQHTTPQELSGGSSEEYEIPF